MISVITIICYYYHLLLILHITIIIRSIIITIIIIIVIFTFIITTIITSSAIHPVRIARIRCPRFVPRVGLPRSRFLTGSLTVALRFSKGWVRKDQNLGLRTGCTSWEAESDDSRSWRAVSAPTLGIYSTLFHYIFYSIIFYYIVLYYILSCSIIFSTISSSSSYY